ncbi:hypothetical protein OOT46_05225 [Aquabacterium sp. A7-Y]|uniref:hypothetical protein n=1 Tax=Aquabacterium sp. A7-Y TaxID=1349605 RepID=UPI00223E862E|nr:hypothetical protein [Aquabacterium sp. A7-Y]MCW7537252.1 hypothetical protein [Aquabacterium sp. A7-Y]
MKSPAFALVFGLLSTLAAADDDWSIRAEKEAQALVGVEYTSRFPGDRIAPPLSCTTDGGGSIEIRGRRREPWWYTQARCQGRAVVMLERQVGRVDRHATMQIADTLLLPRFEVEWDPTNPDALYLYANGSCELNGRTDTSFFALIRWGQRERIDARTGVERAWTFDLKRGRIVPLSTQHIVCYRQDP